MSNNLDLRNTDNSKWLNDNYFLCIYDMEDNYLNFLENIDCSVKFFNKPLKEIYRILKTSHVIELDGIKFKIYLVKKEPIKANCRRR